MTTPRSIVGIGASAGGLEPIQSFFRTVPADSGLAFVVVQHLSPDFRSMMDEILARITALEIHKASEGMTVEPNRIYLNPPKKEMVIVDGRLKLSDRSEGLQLPIDIFFRSLAQGYGKEAVAIVLSGTGSDGSRGLSDIHHAGGFILVQDAGTAKFDGMPRAAIATGYADDILAPEAMPARIMGYLAGHQPKRLPQNADTITTGGDHATLQRIFGLLHGRYGVDFKYYRATTVDRRLERRVQMTRCHSLDDYVDLLADTPAELDILYKDMLIGVTAFFRDREAFSYLEAQVVPSLFKDLGDRNKIRIWNAGCASGEEAYSVAMLVDEGARAAGFDGDIKIFATDMHPGSLQRAKTGAYDRKSLDGVSDDRLERNFEAVGGAYRVKRELRQMLLFSPHNMITDAPFTSLDLVLCRNVLIYFEPIVQEKVLALFHFSLRGGGVLFLGSSESAGSLAHDFEVLSSEYKIYRKRLDAPRLDPRALPLPTTIRARPQRLHARSGASTVTDNTVLWAYEALLSATCDAGVLVDESYDMVHVFGEAREFLTLPTGRTSLGILSLLHDSLATLTGAGLHRAAKDDHPVYYDGVSFAEGSSEARCLKISIHPLRHRRTNARYFFVGIADSERVEPKAVEVVVGRAPVDGARMADLESQLMFTRENLQAANEELETTNEELQSTNEELLAANEELQSSNEELQSTNEELQSTNEELHSVNEELHTVNAEQQENHRVLQRVTSDLDNLLANTELGVIFLDTALCLRRFTPGSTAVASLLPSDVGRPITHVRHGLSIEPDVLEALCQEVLREEKARQREVRATKDRWLLLRCLPYVTSDARIDGVVLTLVDFTERKHREMEAQRYIAELESTRQELQDFAYVTSHELTSPVRAMRGRYGALETALTAGDIDAARVAAQKLQRAHQAMEHTAAGLLEFSRVVTRASEAQSADLGEVVVAARSHLQHVIEERGAQIRCGILPTLAVDFRQLTQVFVQLFSNALKFCTRVPEIHVTAVTKDNVWQVAVRDNGIGIPAEHHEAVFKMLTKLHPEGEYPGAGAGLAVAARIIDRHGGEIRVGSSGDFGTEIVFSLPMSDAVAAT